MIMSTQDKRYFVIISYKTVLNINNGLEIMGFSELNLGKAFRALFSAICWGMGAMVVGGLFAGWKGATIALCVMCYWKTCVTTMASPLIMGLMKTTEKMEKRQTINQALIQDLEEMRRACNELREEFDNFQVDIEKRLESKKKAK